MKPSTIAAPLLAGLALLGAGCAGAPKGVTPVTNFDADRYLGTWYEIARLDHRFERGLSHVTAEYGRLEDGRISVLNKGWDTERDRWKSATATARFQGDETMGSLTVTFQWPFSGGYHVFAVDEEAYQWALVCGPSRSYFWLLARDPDLEPELRDELIEKARVLDFPVDQLIVVEHANRPPE